MLMKKIKISQVVKSVNGRIIHSKPSDVTSLSISSVSTNSKKISKGGLFVPIIGENHDGHNFIEDAYNHGAIACFTSRDDIYHDGLICIKVSDTLEALQNLARSYRNQFSIPLIGITGSVGKTTTKEIVSSVLETKYKVLKTEGNLNSQIGLALMMFRIEEDHDIAVIEMGISQEGEMERLVSIAQPNLAIVTNIGVSHIGLLKTQENIRKEKLNIINKFSNDSCLFINGNDDLLWELKTKKEDQDPSKHENKENSQKFDKISLNKATYEGLSNSKLISFGTRSRNDYRAINIQSIDGKTHFTLVNKDKVIKEDLVINVLGVHNVNNALCAIALAEHFNIPINLAKQGLESYKPIGMRGEIKKAGGLTIIDDTYNASPDSMKSGIDVLISLENVKRKIAVLADVLELGDISKQAHYGVGQFISQKDIDELVTIGNEAKYIAEGLRSHNNNITVHSFNDNGQAIDYLDTSCRPGDALLVKGSRGMKTEEIVNFFINKYN